MWGSSILSCTREFFFFGVLNKQKKKVRVNCLSRPSLTVVFVVLGLSRGSVLTSCIAGGGVKKISKYRVLLCTFG